MIKGKTPDPYKGTTLATLDQKPVHGLENPDSIDKKKIYYWQTFSGRTKRIQRKKRGVENPKKQTRRKITTSLKKKKRGGKCSHSMN